MQGSDTLLGGSGTDSFEAGPGADVIRAADNEVDQINCEGDRDTVFFDQGTDTVANNCEIQNGR
jgi:hypothetical protein